MQDLQELQRRLGYTFQNLSLLQNALYHSSYANEHRSGKDPVSSNERLEFLGDAVLGFVVGEHLYASLPASREGELTRIRSALVCEEGLQPVAQYLDIGSQLLLGHGEESGGGRRRPSILADAVEAVLAAVYLDGGMDKVRGVIHRVLIDHADTTLHCGRRDYKTTLQEEIQRRPGRTLRYEPIGECGPDHAKEFSVAVLLNGEVIGSGTGRSKKEAEQSAARCALEKIKKDG